MDLYDFIMCKLILKLIGGIRDVYINKYVVYMFLVVWIMEVGKFGGS